MFVSRLLINPPQLLAPTVVFKLKTKFRVVVSRIVMKVLPDDRTCRLEENSPM